MSEHLTWYEMLAGLERQESPPHLNDCQGCRARWRAAGEMLSSLAPADPSKDELDRLVQRILAPGMDRGRRVGPALRWAWALGVIVCLAGAAALWRHQEVNLDRQYAVIMSGDLDVNPAGLDELLPAGTITGWDERMQGLGILFEDQIDEGGEGT